MNRLAAILPVSNVLVNVEATSKKRAFEQAGLLFENQHAIARATVTDNLFARERLGSTGLGHGVAIPHGRIKGLKNPLAAVLRVDQAIPFDAPDETHYQAFRAAYESSDEPVHVHCIMNYRVSAFFYRYNREGGMPEAEARAIMERQWQPAAGDGRDMRTWADFIARGDY